MTYSRALHNDRCIYQPLAVDYIDILHDHGLDSPQARAFLRQAPPEAEPFFFRMTVLWARYRNDPECQGTEGKKEGAG